MFAGPLGRSTFTPPKSSFDSPLYGLVSLRRSHFAGTAKLLRESRLSPLALRSRVTTPGGTTAAGLEQLDKHGLNDAFIDALEAAARRSETLADELA